MLRHHLHGAVTIFLAGLFGAGCMGGDVLSGPPFSADMGLTPGGSQDIALAREKIERGVIPDAADFVVEGLLSEHDLPIEGEPCDRVVCVRAAAGVATSLETGNRETFAQVGFSSNIDSATFRRRALNLVAVVDISGSMNGEKMSSTREALGRLIEQLDDRDLFTLVAFDDKAELRLSPTPVTDRKRLGKFIDKLEARGGTCIECGLKLGYLQAEKAHGSGRDSRVMLFTDAQPNVGATGEGEFTDLVSSHANWAGLTAFGVGLDFGQELALAISRIRGGNYVFLRDGDAIRKAFDDELDFLVTPVAYDLKLEITPGDGFTIAAVHGISSWTPGDASASIDVPTLFLSSRRGAIVARLAGDPIPKEPIVNADLGYSEGGEKPVEATLRVDFGDGSPLEEGATWYSQAGVRITVALTNFALGAAKACDLWWKGDRDDAVQLARTVRDYLDTEVEELEDEGLTREAELAGKLVELMEGSWESSSP